MERGLSFIVVAFVISLTSFLLISYSFEGERVSKIESLNLLGAKVLERSLNKLASTLPSHCRNGDRISQIPIKETSHSLSITRTFVALCETNSSPFLYDLKDLFKTEAPCDLERIPSYERSPLGRSLSPKSLISSYVCYDLLAEDTEKFSVKKNLSIASELTFSSNFKITAGGFAEFNLVSTNSDLLIVAGGDLFIADLQITGSPKVSLISATGNVKISRVQGSPKLFAFAPQGIESPYPIKDNGFYPPSKERVIIGIM